EAAASHQLGELLPLLVAGIDTARIVTTGVQQHDVALRRLLQRGEHTAEVQAIARRVEVRIGPLRDVRRFEDLGVVDPGGRAQPESSLRTDETEEVTRDTQPTRPSRSVVSYCTSA